MVAPATSHLDARSGDVIDEWKNTWSDTDGLMQTKYIHGGPQE